jgi:uncharacterized membrane protein YccC
MTGLLRDMGALLRPIPEALWRETEALGSGRWEDQREPVKAVLSVLLAVTIATALHLPDIVWAALSGFMVMRSSLAEAVPRGLSRIFGTIAGAALGLVLARWVAPSPLLLMAALFVFTWIGVFEGTVSTHSYAWMLFGLTAGLVLTTAMATPLDAADFAATRIAEVIIGTGAALVVAVVFEAFGAPPGAGAPQSAGVPGGTFSLRRLWDEAWLAAHWHLVTHAARAAIAVALLPLVWRFFGITDFAQTAVTSYVVMIVPVGAIARGETTVVYQRMVHRALGCLLGGCLALLLLRVAADDVLFWTLFLSLAVWAGYHIQQGATGLGYVGTQFALAFMFTYVQGPGPATSVTPGLERLLGIAIGAAMMALVILLWPPTAEPLEPSAA